MAWLNLAILAVSIVISFVLAPKPPQAKPPALDELDVPTAEPGRPIPVVFGRVRLTSPNVVWYGDLAYRPVRTKSGK